MQIDYSVEIPKIIADKTDDIELITGALFEKHPENLSE
jgi:hypothetical protein